MTITIFNRFFPPQYSGAGQQIERLSKVFNDKNIHVDVVTTRFKKRRIKKSNNPKMNIHEVYTLGSQNIKKIEIIPLSIMQCFWVLKNFSNINTAIFFSIAEENLFPILLLKLLKKRVYIRTSLIQSDDIDTVMQHKFWFFYKYIIRKCDGVICITKKIKKIWDYRLLRLFGKSHPKTYFIPNGIDIPLVNKTNIPNELALRKEIFKRKFNDIKVGVTVGYFNSRKQIDKIIKEWSKLSSEWHLIVLGNYDKKSPTDLSYMATINSYIKNFNLGDRITLKYSRDVRKYLLASDFFVFASKTEGLPNALLEAMSCGLPSVVLKQDWVPRELIEHNNTGLIIDSLDEFSIVLNDLSSNKEKSDRISKLAINRIQDTYDINLVSKKYIELLKYDM